MLIQHIALVPESDGMAASELARVSAALQRQVSRDLTPAFGLSGTVAAFPRLEDVPIGYWPIVISLGELGQESGLHLDESGQPYARVQASDVSQHWSIAASRACLELLVNPYGDRVVTAPSLRSQQGLVDFLLDVTGPCAGPRHVYAINDVLVSDFCLPAYFGLAGDSKDARYSFCGELSMPFQLQRGGHVTWFDALSHRWWLRSYWDDVPVDTDLGTFDRKIVSVRELVRAQRPLLRNEAPAPFDEQVRASRRLADLASQARASRLRALLGARLESQALIDFDDSDEQVEDYDDHDAYSALAGSLSPVDESQLPSTADAEHASEAKVTIPDAGAAPALELSAGRERAGVDLGSEVASARSAHASYAPVEVPAFGEPPGAGRRLGLIFSAIAGAALVLVVWCGQAPSVRSAARGGPPPHGALVSAAKSVSVPEPVKLVAPLPAATPLAPVSAAVVVSPADGESSPTQGPSADRQRRRARRLAPPSNDKKTSSAGLTISQMQYPSSLDELVDTRR